MIYYYIVKKWAAKKDNKSINLMAAAEQLSAALIAALNFLTLAATSVLVDS